MYGDTFYDTRYETAQNVGYNMKRFSEIQKDEKMNIIIGDSRIGHETEGNCNAHFNTV